MYSYILGNNDQTLLMTKGNYFPLRVDAPTFDPGTAHVGAPVDGVTHNPAKIREGNYLQLMAVTCILL